MITDSRKSTCPSVFTKRLIPLTRFAGKAAKLAKPTYRALIFITCISVALFGTSATAADFIVMDVLSIQGELNGSILISYSQTFGTEDCSQVVVKKKIDSASPPLIARAVSNTRLDQVIVTIFKDGALNLEHLQAIFESVLVDRIELTDDGSNLMERIVLRPRNITIKYRPRNADGSPKPQVISTFACQERK